MSDEDGKSGPETPGRPEEEASRLKALAEGAYTSGDLNAADRHAKMAHKLHPSLTGLPEMLAAFRILRTAADPVSEAEKNSVLDYYEILGVEQFSHINTIKKQYKKLAMTLHPDKNPFTASEEAFKLVGEAARVLSDRVRRKEYDTKLRVALQSRVSQESVLAADEEEETFWTACSTCGLKHKFERKYFGQNLMCPSCKKTFKAMEEGGSMEKNGNVQTVRASARIKERVARGDGVGIVEKCGLGVKRRVGRVGVKVEEEDFLLKDLVLKSAKKVVESGEVGAGGAAEGVEIQGVENGLRKKRDGVEKVLDAHGSGSDKGFGLIEKRGENGLRRSRTIGGEERDEAEAEAVDTKKIKRANAREEGTMTLSQIQVLAKKKKKKKKLCDGEGAVGVKEVNDEKEKTDENDKEENDKGKEIEEGENGEVMGNEEGTLKEAKMNTNTNYGEERKEREEEENGKVKEVEYSREKRDRRRVSKYGNWEALPRKSSKNQPNMLLTKNDGYVEMMPVEDSDFHDFDVDRQERSFKKGQVWAVYDDRDGMPRHYALIDKIVSLNPFQVTLSWLHVHRKECTSQACGGFKVSDKVLIEYLNLFSHPVDCERAARQVYRIYPKKGSIWALYGDSNQTYSIVVCLSSYSDAHGLSIAYLEKVPGFRTVFKRCAIGASAVLCLRKDDVEKFSHQIPAKKLSGQERSGLDKDCWELDPAALPPNFLGE